MRVTGLSTFSRLIITALPVATQSFLVLRPGGGSSSGALSMASSSAEAACINDRVRNRVAVVGAGIAGSSLARSLADAGAEVTVFEMGRGPGGRMATRKTRDMPGLAVNHGVPLFLAEQPQFLDFIAPMIESGTVKAWGGKYCELDGQTGKMSPAKLPGGIGYVASPDMSSVCEVLLEGIEQKYQSQVADIKMESDGWTLKGKNQEDLGHYEWLCVTSHTMGHPRWTSVFGTEPPLKAILGAPGEGDAELQALIAPLESVVSSPVMICMVAYRKDDPQVKGLMELGFDVADVQGHAIVKRIVRQFSGDFVSLVVHSTHSFAAENVDVYGSTSAAAKLAPSKWTSDDNKKREAETLAVLYAEAQNLLKESTGPLPQPVWGPFLHRWGSAFCSPAATPLPAVSNKYRLALCGDFAVGAEAGLYFGVESAALSGLEVAKAIIKANKLESKL